MIPEDSKPSPARPAPTPAVRALPFVLGAGIGLAVVAVALVASPIGVGEGLARDWRLKPPAFALLAAQPPALQIHIAAALTAVFVGAALMLRPKGVGLHKAMGWTWVAAMAVTAGSSFFLTGLNGERLSLIHLLSGWTAVSLPVAVVAIRRGDVARHRRTMTSLFFGGLLIAGALTFIPGRLMWRVFFG